MPAHAWLAAALALPLLLAGCSADGGARIPDSGLGPAGSETDDAGPWTYATDHPAGAPRVLDLTGSITTSDLTDMTSVPGGPSVGPSQTCCSIDWVPVPDLVAEHELVALRLTVNWTNTPDNHAGLDAAVCVPWWCQSYAPGPDESGAMGAHSSTFSLYTSGRPEFHENGNEVALGARYVNARITSGLAYTLRVEVEPVPDGLAAADPYLLTLPQNGTLTVELVGPFADGDVSGGLLFYGDDDRPVHWHAVEGPHGSRHEVPLDAGEYVVFPMEMDGGFMRLSTDTWPAGTPEPRLERLDEEFGVEVLATVTDAQAATEGTQGFAAPPGSLDLFPFFLFDDKPAVQDPLGVGAPGMGGTQVQLSSSEGTIAVVDLAEVSYQMPSGTPLPAGRYCMQCSFALDFDPANYVDDDGTYEVAWSTQGGTGQVVLFTARYLR